MIYSNSETSEQFLVTEYLEQSEFKLEKIVGILKHAGKVRKCFFPEKLAETQSVPSIFMYLQQWLFKGSLAISYLLTHT